MPVEPVQPDTIPETDATYDKRKLVERIVRSDYFKRSKRLRNFLAYVSECGLSGRTNEINEQLIGIRVFNRPSTYNTAEDNIVRTHARLLRQKLEVFYAAEGANEPIRLHIPKGSYVPVFEPVIESQDDETPEPPAVSTLDNQPVNLPRPAQNKWRFALLGAFAGCVVGVLATWLVFRGRTNMFTPRHASHSVGVLWSTLFSKDRPTLIVVGDAGVLMYQNLSKSSVTMDEYAYRTYEKSPFAQTPPGYKWFPLALRTYTAFNEIEPIRYLLSLHEAQSTKVRIVFARDLLANDLRHNNLIFLGGPGYDPWEQAFQGTLDFRMEQDVVQSGFHIVNVNPEKGEEQTYSYVEGDPTRRGYGVIALTDNLSGDGHILLIQGTTALGDGMAAEFLESEADLAPILDKAQAGKSIRNFGVLLSTTFAGTSWSHWNVVARRIH